MSLGWITNGSLIAIGATMTCVLTVIDNIDNEISAKDMLCKNELLALK